MCGRFTLKSSPEQLVTQFRLSDTPQIEPHFNIAPTNDVATVRAEADGIGRKLDLLHWGFVPVWAKDPSVGNRMINARSETAATSPAFKRAFRERRCLIVADGFFEWQRIGNKKQPYYIRLEDGEPFAFAGLWEAWRGPDGATLQSCTLLTTAPNDLVRSVHDRMPVILAPSAYDQWLDPQVKDPAALMPLLQSYPAEEMMAYPVSTLVNNPRNDHPENIAPAE